MKAYGQMRILQVFKCRQHNPRTTLLIWVLEARQDAFKLRDVRQVQKETENSCAE